MRAGNGDLNRRRTATGCRQDAVFLSGPVARRVSSAKMTGSITRAHVSHGPRNNIPSDRRVGSSAVQHAIDGFEGRSTASKANATNERSRVVKTVTRRAFACGVALLPSFHFTAVRAKPGVSPAGARTIAREAYIYGFPIVDSYRIQHAY